MRLWNLYKECIDVDDVITHGLIAELQQKVSQLEQKLDKMESELSLFSGCHFWFPEPPDATLCFIADSRCAFAARGFGSDSTKIINDSPIVYNEVEFNVCNAYNATTGKRLQYGEIIVLRTGIFLRTWSQPCVGFTFNIYIYMILVKVESKPLEWSNNAPHWGFL